MTAPAYRCQLPASNITYVLALHSTAHTAGFAPGLKDVSKTPGPGAYSVKSDFDRIPHRDRKGFDRAKKDTLAGFSSNFKDAASTPGPGAYIVKGDFDKPKPRPAVASLRKLPPQYGARNPPSAAGTVYDSPHDAVANMQWSYASAKMYAEPAPLHARPTAAWQSKIKGER